MPSLLIRNVASRQQIDFSNCSGVIFVYIQWSFDMIASCFVF